MKVDLLNDLIVIGKMSVHISTLIGWGSGLLGLYGNYRQMKKLNKMEDEKARKRAVKEMAERCYLKIERITKLTPTKLDDKLAMYLKLAFDSYKDTYDKKPSTDEVKELIAHAETMATKDKLRGKN